MAKRLGGLDVGQTVCVKDQAVLAVEAIEGTDACIRRAGDLCRQGGFTVVKVAKPQQDMRFDVPTVGAGTLESIAAAGGRVLAIEADRTILLDAHVFREAAERLKISVVALARSGRRRARGVVRRNLRRRVILSERRRRDVRRLALWRHLAWPIALSAFAQRPTSRGNRGAADGFGAARAQSSTWAARSRRPCTSAAPAGSSASRATPKRIPAVLLKALDLKHGQTVCDFGCGNGFYTLQLAKRVGPRGVVYAVDIQPEMLDLLAERAEPRGLDNVKPVLATADDSGPAGRRRSTWC